MHARSLDAASEKKIRILYLIDKIGTGGAASHIFQVLRNLNKKKFFPIVCCLVGGAAKEYDPEGYRYMIDQYRALGAVVEILHMECIYDPRYWLEFYRLTRIIRKFRIDLIHVYLFSSTIVGTLIAVIMGVPIRIASRRESATRWMRWYHHWAMRFAYFFCPVVVVNSKEIGEQCLILEKVPEQKIRLIYNGIDWKAFLDLKKVSQGRSIDDQRRKCHIGMVGNMVPIKGHKYLLDAMVRVIKECPSARLTLVGDGPLKKELMKQTEALDLVNAVHFAGRRKAEEWLHLFGIAVQSSLSEGGSNVMLEYMASALPMVVTAVGANREILRHGETALLVPPGDSCALAESIIFLLKNPRKANQLGKAAFSKVIQEFTAAKMVSQMEELYLDLCYRKKR